MGVSEAAEGDNEGLTSERLNSSAQTTGFVAFGDGSSAARKKLTRFSLRAGGIHALNCALSSVVVVI